MQDPGTLSDEELLRDVRAGSETAFTALYRRHERAVYRFAFQMSGSAAVAEEVVQEVFLAVIRQPGRYDPGHGPLEAFLHGIARNHVLRSFERDARYVSAEESADEPAAIDEDALSGIMANQEAGLLRKAVLSLPAVYREALALCDLEELDYETAAQRIGCPVGTVRSRLHRARALLAAKLGAGKAAKV